LNSGWHSDRKWHHKLLFAPRFQGFYLYLYLGSLLFLCYMYAGVMKEEVVLSVSRKTSAFEMSNSKFIEAVHTKMPPYLSTRFICMPFNRF
jgi:hypothetical protein